MANGIMVAVKKTNSLMSNFRVIKKLESMESW